MAALFGHTSTIRLLLFSREPSLYARSESEHFRGRKHFRHDQSSATETLSPHVFQRRDGVHVDARTNVGMTALQVGGDLQAARKVRSTSSVSQCAAIGGDPYCVHALLQAGASIGHCCRGNMDPLSDVSQITSSGPRASTSVVGTLVSPVPLGSTAATLATETSHSTTTVLATPGHATEDDAVSAISDGSLVSETGSVVENVRRDQDAATPKAEIGSGGELALPQASTKGRMSRRASMSHIAQRELFNSAHSSTAMTAVPKTTTVMGNTVAGSVAGHTRISTEVMTRAIRCFEPLRLGNLNRLWITWIARIGQRCASR